MRIILTPTLDMQLLPTQKVLHSLSQLGYIVGDSVRNKILLEYYRIWKFKHPNANDFIRVAEKTSGISLQWYKEYWVNSTKTN